MANEDVVNPMYRSRLHEVSNEGKLNIYTCKVCRGHIVTIDRDAGVTPFSLKCRVTEGCRGLMNSSVYRVFDQTMRPSHEWYRPSAKELSTMIAQAKEHVERGGLILRKCED